MNIPCKYCERHIDSRGMLSHVHFRHRVYVSREFCRTPIVWAMLWAEEGFAPPGIWEPQLPASIPDRPAQDMLAPVAKIPRWI